MAKTALKLLRVGPDPQDDANATTAALDLGSAQNARGQTWQPSRWGQTA